jgi:hypothetical protein
VYRRDLRLLGLFVSCGRRRLAGESCDLRPCGDRDGRANHEPDGDEHQWSATRRRADLVGGAGLGLRRWPVAAAAALEDARRNAALT